MNRRKNKVLFLTNIPAPYSVYFFNELGKLCDLTVLFERKTSNERELAWFNNNFTDFKAVFLEGIKINKNIALCFSVTKYLKRELFDLIIVGGYATPTGMLAINYLKLKKIPFVLNADGGFINKNESFLKRVIKKYYIASADFWLSTSEITNSYLEHYGANSKAISIYPFTSLLQKDIIKCPIDDKTRKNLRDKLNICEEKVILYVGQFIHRKGIDVLLKACTKIPKEYGVYIVGGRPTQEYLVLIKKFGLSNVHFIGFRYKEELKEYYMASDLFVLPAREDIWGLVINEAMAYGLPVVTTDKCIAGLELVKNYKNGFIVPVEDERILANKINKILKDDDLRTKMAKNSLVKIKQYTIENMAKLHMRIFSNFLECEK